MKAKTFSERIHKETIATLTLPKRKKERDVLMKRVSASLLGERLSDDHLPIKKYSPKRAYLRELHTKYTELKESLERLKLCLRFFSRIQNYKTISKLEYIRYHYEFYLNEIYIFSERLDQLFNFLFKKCQKANLIEEGKRIREIKININDALRNIVKVRGLHVHKRRHRTNKLDQLQTLHTLSADFDFIREYRDYELKAMQKVLKKEIRGNIDALNKLLENEIYRELGTVIFNKIMRSQKGRVIKSTQSIL